MFSESFEAEADQPPSRLVLEYKGRFRKGRTIHSKQKEERALDSVLGSEGEGRGGA